MKDKTEALLIYFLSMLIRTQVCDIKMPHQYLLTEFSSSIVSLISNKWEHDLYNVIAILYNGTSCDEPNLRLCN